MIIDADLYRSNLRTINHMLEGKSCKEAIEMIGIISSATFVHVAIVTCYVGEIIGFKDEIFDLLTTIMKFYRLKGIDNVYMGVNKVGIIG